MELEAMLTGSSEGQGCLLGQNVVITGASGGLGAHFASVALKAGATVHLAARRRGQLEEMAQALGCDERVFCYELDVSDTQSIASMAEKVTRCDVLLNNAGTVHEGEAFSHDEEAWDRVMGTNVKGAFFMAQAFGRKMKDAGKGSIINVASILGLRQAAHVVSYAASKAALIQVSKSLALEWARFGIRVNALAPGYVRTDLNASFWESDAGKSMVARIPTRRLGEMEDLNGALLLLASDESRHITGSVITVDGGHLVGGL